MNQNFRCLWETHQATESSVIQSGVSTNNVFYLVNPDQTLPKTQVPPPAKREKFEEKNEEICYNCK